MFAADGKCPGKRHKTRRNCYRGMKMSRESPQIREEIVYRRGNILLFGGFPGETIAEE
jgi:hypothetical protein